MQAYAQLHGAEPRIEVLPQKKLVGKKLTMTLTSNRTAELWGSFMPRRKEVKNTVSSNLYSMQVYDASFDFKNFNLETVFEKWAAVEVSDFEDIPEDMESYILKGGQYAVFIHKGTPSAFLKTFQFIFGYWIPQSGYEVDNREHFELLGEKYKNNQPDSEEEVWVPIRKIS